MFKPLFFIN